MKGDAKKGLPEVAYFCMEYGLHEEFPIYSGGLGILAGDYLKSCGDLELPVVGVGILWRHGYTNQFIGADGRPYDTYPRYSHDCVEDSGVTVRVTIHGREVACKVWKTQKYGNAPLLLLDTDLPENAEGWITGYLYGGYGSQDRVAQEMVLGIGGIRALRTLGISPGVYHLNEGHAVFAALELIREKMAEGMGFDDAWNATRREVVFTTHTPIMAGNESHDLAVLEYAGAFNGLTREQMVRIGGDPFNMTVAALRLSRISNAVSRLHGETARRMWAEVSGSSPIISITNGVHPGTWQHEAVRNAYETGGDLWIAHQAAKAELIREVKEQTGVELKPDVLLMGFARRAASYKRADLILRRGAVIEPWLNQGKLQIIFAGKAHPRDEAGKDMIARLVSFAARYPGRVVFLQNYDMKLGKLLTRGCDVWLNNPRRPQEASGTSGMKAAMNGVLNLSVLDGWWPEGCIHGRNGWQIGGGYEGPGQDERDLKSLHDVLICEVIPTYYHRREHWLAMMRESIKMAQKFSSHRMAREYFDRLYPASASSDQAAAGQ